MGSQKKNGFPVAHEDSMKKPAQSSLTQKAIQALADAVAKVLIRCVENKPVTVILGTAFFLAGVIGLIARMLHLSGFL